MLVEPIYMQIAQTASSAGIEVAGLRGVEVSRGREKREEGG